MLNLHSQIINTANSNKYPSPITEVMFVSLANAKSLLGTWLSQVHRRQTPHNSAKTRVKQFS